MPDLPPLEPIATQPVSLLLLARAGVPDGGGVRARWEEVLRGLGRDYEVIVAEGAGEGEALRRGLAEARYPVVATATCDGRYDPADLPRLLAEIDRLHLVSGCRAGPRAPLPLRLLGWIFRGTSRVLVGFAPERLPAWRGLGDYGYRLLARAVFAVRLRDVGCVLRVARRDIFARIPIQSDGVFAHVEVLAKANFLGCYFSDEVTVAYHPGPPRPEPWWRDFRRVLNRPSFGPPPTVTPSPPRPEPDPALPGGEKPP